MRTTFLKTSHLSQKNKKRKERSLSLLLYFILMSGPPNVLYTMSGSTYFTLLSTPWQFTFASFSTFINDAWNKKKLIESGRGEKKKFAHASID